MTAAEVWTTLGDELGIGGRVEGTGWLGITAAPETVMVTYGLPVPQSAVTAYEPDAPGAIVAEPEKLIWVWVTVAEPPTKAAEKTPRRPMPLFGHVPRTLTLWPGAAVPGLTISWPYPVPAIAGPAEASSAAAAAPSGTASSPRRRLRSRSPPRWRLTSRSVRRTCSSRPFRA